MENSKLPAFASPGTYNPNNLEHNGDSQMGLTKREYFAAMALQGLMANSSPYIVIYNEEKFTEWCIRYADELLKQLEEK